MKQPPHPIHMVDLKGQYRHIALDIDLALRQAIDEAQFIQGPQVHRFAKRLGEYIGAPYVIPVANGTDALQIAMMALDLKPGDEVIVPAFTYVATAEVIALLGLKPVWIDVHPEYFTLDVGKLESVLTSNTKAIVPVHLYGQCADMNAIVSFAKNHNLYVIEDTAQAIGAYYSYADEKQVAAGLCGDIGCTSFFPSKNLGCYGDGGALYTNNQELADKMKYIANHGQKVKYRHEMVGVNSRLDTLQAAILEVKLTHLAAYTAARQQAAQLYNELLADIPQIQIPARYHQSTHVFHQYTLKVKQGRRDDLKSYLEECGIPSMIYYPIPMHLQPAYESSAYAKGAFPVSESLCSEVLSLPMHTELQHETQVYISNTIREFFTDV